jgi:putative DNA primase/helicase
MKHIDLPHELQQLRPVRSMGELGAAAFEAGRLVVLGVVGLNHAVDRVTEMAVAAGLVAEYGEDAVQATIADGFRAADVGANDAAAGDLSDDDLVVNNYEPDARAPKETSTRGRHLVSRRASEVAPRDIEFLWDGRLARGKHTCVGGEPGGGKSQLSFAVAAAITTGGIWPCDEGCAPVADVIILNAEDAQEDTIIPRLMAASADLRRVHLVNAVREGGRRNRAFSLLTDLDLLEKKIDEINKSGNVLLVIIDPISAYLGKTDSHKNSEVRGVLEPVSEMAARKGVAVLSITHFSKSGAGAGTKALHRFVGSIAFVGAPRAAFAVVEDPQNEGRMFFLHAKNNMGKRPQGLAFRMEQRLLDGLSRPVSFITWESEPVTITANQALGSNDHCETTATDDAVEFLRVVLAESALKVIEVEAEARAACLLGAGQSISQSKPFRAARKILGIKPYQAKGERASGWVWSLPEGQMP